jgi:glutaconate CoA-transferase subunit A
VPGYYNRDHQVFIDYRNESKTAMLFEKWLNHRVDNIRSPHAYLDLLGPERMAGLAIKNHVFSEPVDYGY